MAEDCGEKPDGGAVSQRTAAVYNARRPKAGAIRAAASGSGAGTLLDRTRVPTVFKRQGVGKDMSRRVIVSVVVVAVAVVAAIVWLKRGSAPAPEAGSPLPAAVSAPAGAPASATPEGSATTPTPAAGVPAPAAGKVAPVTGNYSDDWLARCAKLTGAAQGACTKALDARYGKAEAAPVPAAK
jgi:hypothetical protein